MRTFTTSLLLLIFWNIAYSQITITNVDVANVGLEVRRSVAAPMQGQGPGSAGANQSWDFSMLSPISHDTLIFTNPIWTPNGGDFPLSNLAVELNFGSSPAYIYLQNHVSNLLMEGQSVDFGNGQQSISFSPAYTMLQFPVAWQNSSSTNTYREFTQESLSPGQDSIRFHTAIERTYNVDGWGNLTLPMGSYDALRMNVVETHTDSMYVLSGGVWTLQSTFVSEVYQVDYWTNDSTIGFALLSIALDSAGNVESLNYISEIPTATLIADFSRDIEMKMYPNPVREELNLQWPTDENVGRFELYDLYGRLLMQGELNGVGQQRIDVSSLAAGQYVCVVREDSGTVLSRAQVHVVH